MKTLLISLLLVSQIAFAQSVSFSVHGRDYKLGLSDGNNRDGGAYPDLNVLNAIDDAKHKQWLNQRDAGHEAYTSDTRSRMDQMGARATNPPPQLYTISSSQNNIREINTRRLEREIVTTRDYNFESGNDKLGIVLEERNYAAEHVTTKEGRYLVSLADNGLNVADRHYLNGRDEEGDFALKITRTFLDLATSFTPGVSFARDLWEAVTGLHMITGAELDTFERSMAILGVVTGGMGKHAARGINVLSEVTGAKRVLNPQKWKESVAGTIHAVTDAIIAKQVWHPYENRWVRQSLKGRNMRARAEVKAGRPVYRVGIRDRKLKARPGDKPSQTGGQAQFWAIEHPNTPGYRERHALPNGNDLDFIETGVLKPDAKFVTKTVDPYRGLPGGAIEVLTDVEQVIVTSHSSL